MFFRATHVAYAFCGLCRDIASRTVALVLLAGRLLVCVRWFWFEESVLLPHIGRACRSRPAGLCPCAFLHTYCNMQREHAGVAEAIAWNCAHRLAPGVMAHLFGSCRKH